jgi:hypothetical protein
MPEMKLRIRGDSVRLRLTRGEVARLGAGGRVEEATRFGPGPEDRLAYSLETSEEAGGIRAAYSAGLVRLVLPGSLAREWAGSEQVSLEAEQPLGGGESLRVLVEKDFACLTKRGGAEDADTYPHPQEGLLTC